MSAIRPKEISLSDRNEILALERKDITRQLLQDYFACYYGQTAPRFNTYDTFTLPAGKLYPGVPAESIKTTIGRYLINMFVLPKQYLLKFGYFNETITKSTLGGLEGKLAAMVLNDEIPTKEYAEYLDNGEWIAMGTAYYLVPTMNYDINVPIKEVIELRDKLFDQYQEGIRKGDSDVANTIEKQVIALAKKKIIEKGNESFDFFEAGVGSFENNYKKTSIMAGAIENPYTKKLDILKSNYIDGIDKKEFPKFSNLTLIGGYSRGVETQASGAETKRINNAMQVIMLDEPGTDCGTKLFEEVELFPDIAKLFVNRYILDPSSSEADKSNGLVLLTDQNIKKYTGKTVKMRSPLFCKSDKICNKCAGELFYKIGIRNAGLLNSTMSGKLMNLSMKKFHDSTVKFDEIDIEKYIK